MTDAPPQLRPGQTLEQHQAEVAAWAGYGSVDELNRDHDPMHAALATLFGVTSYALRHAAGEKLTNEEMVLAVLEETAVLYCQRWIAHAGGKVVR
jgi:hypothetical protein